MGAHDETTARNRAAFTNQASRYATNAAVANQATREAFVARVAPAPTARVLDVATGPAFTALAFAQRTRFVLGLDLTPAMLVQAQQARAAAGRSNLHFARGEATALPIATGAFDVVGCATALHHFAAPLPPLRELRRVCRPGGTIAISDLVSDEDPQRSAEHNAIEQLRDPAHVWCYPISELVAMLRSLGLYIRSAETTTTRRGLDEWLAITRPSADRAAQIRARLAATIAADRAGLAPAWEDGELHFTHTTAWIIATVPAEATHSA